MDVEENVEGGKDSEREEEKKIVNVQGVGIEVVVAVTDRESREGKRQDREWIDRKR